MEEFLHHLPGLHARILAKYTVLIRTLHQSEVSPCRVSHPSSKSTDPCSSRSNAASSGSPRPGPRGPPAPDRRSTPRGTPRRVEQQSGMGFKAPKTLAFSASCRRMIWLNVTGTLLFDTSCLTPLTSTASSKDRPIPGTFYRSQSKTVFLQSTDHLGDFASSARLPEVPPRGRHGLGATAAAGEGRVRPRDTAVQA